MCPERLGWLPGRGEAAHSQTPDQVRNKTCSDVDSSKKIEVF